MTKPLTYADAGVDIDKANRFVGAVKKIAETTTQKGVLGGIGGFGGLFAPDLSGMSDPILVSATDGVGTKLKIAFMMDRHDTIGIDLVAMSVNDIIVQGAKPLFFLDYLSVGKLDETTATAIVSGVGEGCRQARCALIGGETAEMPGLYADNEYDLAGFAVGLVDRAAIMDGSTIQSGDQLIGIASSGLHSNGYSLVRKICFDHLKLKVDDHVAELGGPIGEALLTPTQIYVDTLFNTLEDIPLRGVAHITGGGLSENIVRVVPKAFGIEVRQNSWPLAPIFQFLQQAGNVETSEMQRTFNNGIGLVVVVPETDVQKTLDRLNTANQKAWHIGRVVDQVSGMDRVQWV